MFKISKNRIFVMALMLSVFPLCTGCALAESVALEDNSLDTTTENTITTQEVTTTISEATTHIVDYTPFLTMNSIYEPSQTTTEETTTDMVTTIAPSFDDSIFTEEVSETDTTTAPVDVTTIETTTQTTKITKMFEVPPTTTTITDTNTINSYNNSNSYNVIDSSYFFEDCAFIGDSLTVGLSMYEFIPSNNTFAQEGISLLGINSLQLYTNYGYVYPTQAISYWNSKHIYILLGINGVTWISNDTAIEHYTQLINSIRQYNPNVEDINIVSVLPVAHSMEIIDTVENGRILNSEIDAFNDRLKSMANSLDLNYININSYLKNSNGCLPDEVTVDGLHLTQDGYQRYMDILLQYVQNSNR